MSRVGVILRPGMARRDSLCISRLMSMTPAGRFRVLTITPFTDLQARRFEERGN